MSRDVQSQSLKTAHPVSGDGIIVHNGRRVGNIGSAFIRSAAIGMLALSFLLSVYVSLTAEPLSGPDERHHYSRIQDAARNPYEFPPRLEALETQGEANHLMHPPLYYSLMAFAYHFLRVDQILTPIGVEFDSGGQISGVASSRALRSFSLILSALHLMGMYAVIVALRQRDLISDLGSLFILTIATLLPAGTYIAGVLNNDVLGLALYPLLLLTTLKLTERRGLVEVAQFVTVISAIGLTKATMWPLALTAALVVVCLQLVLFYFGGRGENQATHATRGLRRSRFSAAAWLILALGSAAVTSAYFMLTLLRYESFQPGYSDVYDLSTEQRQQKFFVGPPDEPMSRGELGTARLVRVARSSVGILSHTTRIYHLWPEMLVLVFFVGSIFTIAVIHFAVSQWRTDDVFSPVLQRHGKTAFYVYTAVTPLLFALIFALRNYEGYLESGYFAGQGRYFLGYFTLWAISLAMASHALVELFFRDLVSPDKWRPIVAGMGVTLLFGVIWAIQPVLYLQSPGTPLDRQMVVESRLESELLERGFSAARVTPVSPDRFRNSDALDMNWRNSRAEAHIIVSGDACLSFVLMARGDTKQGEPSRMTVELTGDDGSVLLTDTFFAPTGLAILEGKSIPVRHGTFSIAIQLMNHRAEWDGLTRILPAPPHRSTVRAPRLVRLLIKVDTC